MSKVVLLTQSSVYAKIVANEIHQKVPLAAIYTENKKRDAVNPSIRKFINRIRLMKKSPIEREVVKLENTLENQSEQFLKENYDFNMFKWPKDVNINDVSDINSENSFHLLAELNPDLILLFGTSVLKDKIINTARLGVINAHTSILPDYRGNFVEFWQVLNEDLDKAGVTIHYVNSEVDRGDIIFQKSFQEQKKNIDPYMLRIYNILTINQVYGDIAKQVLEGKSQRFKQDAAGQAYKAKDMTLDKRIELYKKLGYLKV